MACGIVPRIFPSKRWIIICIATILFAVVVLALLWNLSRSRTFQVFGTIIPRVETIQPIIALTFDDGPTPWATEEILSILDETGTSATFFLIGQDLKQHPESARRIISAGHEIGNHTYSHKRMVLKSQGFIKAEIESTDALIHDAGYTSPTLFRPPYGKKLFGLPWYLSQNNRVSITWDVEPETYPEVAASSQSITNHVITHVRPGSIILLHVMYDKNRVSLQAVKPIVEGLRDRGYRFVTVSDLLSAK